MIKLLFHKGCRSRYLLVSGARFRILLASNIRSLLPQVIQPLDHDPQLKRVHVLWVSDTCLSSGLIQHILHKT
jgi:hypothetical protein